MTSGLGLGNNTNCVHFIPMRSFEGNGNHYRRILLSVLKLLLSSKMHNGYFQMEDEFINRYAGRF